MQSGFTGNGIFPMKLSAPWKTIWKEHRTNGGELQQSAEPLESREVCIYASSSTPLTGFPWGFKCGSQEKRGIADILVSKLCGGELFPEQGGIF